ncbi:MAG: hypothetical protein M1818_004879 [Claussenomyces sp. TS43310]|nr:MAG: hypothetical protein M1818_004879 [Claussenomyces sp. TS43310]
MGMAKKEKDGTRAERKAKKRRAEDAISDLPGDSEAVEAEGAAIQSKRNSSRKRQRLQPTGNVSIFEARTEEKRIRDKDRKPKRADRHSTSSDDVENLPKAQPGAPLAENKAQAPATNAIVGGQSGMSNLSILHANEPPKKSKKDRKAEKKAAELSAATKTTTTTTDEQGHGEVIAPPDDAYEATPNGKKNNRNRERRRKGVKDVAKKVTDEARETEGKAPRFIVFIGNLPYSTTTASIQKHFAIIKPKSVRHLTRKDDPSKSKGCAFVEFEGYDHMKTCLKQFHHSTFDDGLSAPRKINVELTVGGGGKTEHRIAKIGEKNQKLDEERIRRMHEEEKAKLVRREAAIDHNAVHPSRRARVPDVS